MRRVHEDGEARELRLDRLKEFQLFAGQPFKQRRHAGGVASGMREAGHEPIPERITRTAKHNRNRRSDVLDSTDHCRSSPSHDHIDRKPDQLGGEVGKLFYTTFRAAVFQHIVLPLDPA
jgi:hypothetical protein